MYEIRPFDPCENEFTQYVSVYNAIWPDSPSTVDEMKFNHSARNAKFLHRRFVVEEDGALIGWNTCWESAWSHVPGKYGMEVQLHPDHESRELRQSLYEHIWEFLEARDPAPQILTGSAREDKPAVAQFWRDNGFEQVMRYPRSQLDVRGFDFSRYDGLEEKVTASGIEIVTLTQVQERNPGWMQPLYEGFCAVLHDIPSMDETTPQPIDRFAKQFEAPDFTPDGWFLAMDGDKMVGISNLWKDSALPEKIYVGLTGVLRSHRRQGIATALKLRTVEFTQQFGAYFIETDNEENNPMFELNLKMGFEPLPAWLDYRKEL